MLIQSEIDAVHEEKLHLSDIARLISTRVVIEELKLGQPYTGTSSIDHILTTMVGIRKGIELFVAARK